MKEKVVVALGGNFPDSQKLLELAIKEISLLPFVKNLNCSRLYRSSPLEMEKNAADFFNAVALFHTEASPEVLWSALCSIETKLGKRPKPKNASRPLDIDFIFYGNKKLQTKELTIPHPNWQKRLFVLLPLKDVWKETSLPLCDETLDSLILEQTNTQDAPLALR